MTKMFDVAIVGYGPVGMAMAALLGQSGHHVVVLERYPGKYNLPRAAIFDDETMRTFAKLGIAETMLPKVHAQRNYEWRNAAGDLLIEHDFAEYGRSGWAEWYMMYQPDLEDALDTVCQALPTVEVRFGAPVAAIEQDEGGATLHVEDGSTIRARYVVACDGGNSFVRRALDIPMDDYGFSEPWMVCDFRLKGPTSVPMARQVCDPAQPISIISLGPDHHRFSFMLGTDEDPDEAGQPDHVWRRVSAYLSPEQAELIRAATYTFRSLVAQRWREGVIVLAGDAAHQMPPFLGQGMCSGVRDALNLSFKFDLLLSGRAEQALLDTYQSERDEHVRAVIRKGIELGRVQTMRDPAAAAARDAELIAKRRARAAREKIVFPALGQGIFGSGPGARELMEQGFVRRDGRRDRFDALVGYGPVVVARAPATIDMDQRAALRAAGIRLAILSHDPSSPEAIEDTDGTYQRWFDARGRDVAAIRPDFHVWGTASSDRDEVDQLLRRFAEAMTGETQSVPEAADDGVAVASLQH